MDLLQELTELSTKYAINLDSLIIKLDIEQSTRGGGLEDVWVGTYKEDRVAVKALRGVWVNRSVMRVRSSIAQDHALFLQLSGSSLCSERFIGGANSNTKTFFRRWAF